MPAKQEKKSNGAGKFFLGAAIGAAIGAIASKFIDVNVNKDGGEEIEPGCNSNKKAKAEKKIEKKVEKETEKKSEKEKQESAK